MDQSYYNNARPIFGFNYKIMPRQKGNSNQFKLQQSAKDSSLKKAIASSKSKTEVSIVIGKAIGKKAIDSKIKKVVFDRNGYPFHGRVKAFADAAREEGLEF